MPRKPGIGPAILSIEGLSTGIDPTLVDDLTGQPIAQPNAKVPHTAQTLGNAISKHKAQSALRMLIASGIVKPTDSAPQAPKLQPNQRLLGDSLVITMPAKPFRRI